MSTTRSKLCLPQIEKVSLRRFSLFAANPDAEFECNDGVVCLIGANGIGKSTLLSAINYGLTGIVADPNQRFESFSEYYRDSKGYSKAYFQGRISESDRGEAEITLKFRVGDYHYSVTRGLFEPEELRALTITNKRDDTVYSTEKETRAERQKIYETRLTEHSGLFEFGEFVFLQLFVFSFDERRVTLFWNQKILERVLYLAFGVDQTMANKADELRRDIEKADSRVRNFQWDATKTSRRINELRAKYKSTSATQEAYDKLAKEHEKYTNQLTKEVAALELVEKQIKDANLRLAALSARDSALRDEYAEYFARGFERRPPLAQHPLLIKGFSTKTCTLCGAQGTGIERVLRAKTESHNCPLCDSLLPTAPPTKGDVERLKALDKEIASVKKQLSEIRKELERVTKDEKEASISLDKTKVLLATFDKENEKTMLLMLAALEKDGGIDGLLASYKGQLDQILREKKEAEQNRAKSRDELLSIQRMLQKQYITFESKFVPAFTELAHLFLGMDLHIRMDASESTGLKLVAEVRGTARRQSDQLSESQRFFIDIALRMALIRFASLDSAKGGLFIDTPEGSLDIAYEKRAGEMLAKFVAAGHRVLMTANLNTSKLLLALANNCGQRHMSLCRMTDWAELSEVQQAEEGVFDEAYEAIETALKN